MLLVHSEELVPLLFFKPHRTIANVLGCTGGDSCRALLILKQTSGMGQSLVKCSPLTWRSQESIKCLSTSGQHRDSVPVWWSLRYLWNQNYPGCWQWVIAPSRSVAFIFETWSDNPTDHLSIQPYDLQPHRAAIHPHSFLHRRRWKWCYQEFAYGQRMHRRLRDLVQGHAVCVSELNPLNTRPFYLILTSNVCEYIFPLWFKLDHWFPTLKQFPAFPWHEFWTHPLKAYGLFLASKWIYKLGKACEPEFESQPNNLFWL